MAKQMYAVGGCQFFIGDSPMDRSFELTEEDFNAVTWVRVKGWTQMGASGFEWNEVSSEQIDEEEVIFDKGTKSRPMMENGFDRIPDDEGQLKLVEALGSRLGYPVRIRYNDAPTDTGTPSERKMVGLVMSDSRSGGASNDPRRMTASIRPISNYVDTPGAA